MYLKLWMKEQISTQPATWCKRRFWTCWVELWPNDHLWLWQNIWRECFCHLARNNLWFRAWKSWNWLRLWQELGSRRQCQGKQASLCLTLQFLFLIVFRWAVKLTLQDKVQESGTSSLNCSGLKCPHLDNVIWLLSKDFIEKKGQNITFSKTLT